MVSDVIQHIRFLATPTTGLALVVLLAGAAGVAWWLRHTGRSSRHFAILFAAVASLALVIAVTLVRDLRYFLVRDGLPVGFTPGQLFSWSTSGWRRISYDPFGDSEVLLNIALFIPAGAAWTLLTSKPLRVLAGLISMSLLVECLQAVFAGGSNDVADLIANSTGAALGVLAGAIVLWLVPQLGHRARPTPRRTALAAGAVVVVAAAVITGVHVGAERRQAALEQELLDLFAGTSLAQYRTWEAADRLSERVFGAASVFTDGTQDLNDAVRVRYPASYFGIRRCVFVEWTPEAVRISPSAGAYCTEFIG